MKSLVRSLARLASVIASIICWDVTLLGGYSGDDLIKWSTAALMLLGYATFLLMSEIYMNTGKD